MSDQVEKKLEDIEKGLSEQEAVHQTISDELDRIAHNLDNLQDKLDQANTRSNVLAERANDIKKKLKEVSEHNDKVVEDNNRIVAEILSESLRIIDNSYARRTCNKKKELNDGTLVAPKPIDDDDLDRMQVYLGKVMQGYLTKRYRVNGIDSCYSGLPCQVKILEITKTHIKLIDSQKIMTAGQGDSVLTRPLLGTKLVFGSLVLVFEYSLDVEKKTLSEEHLLIYC